MKCDDWVIAIQLVAVGIPVLEQEHDGSFSVPLDCVPCSG